MGYYRLPLRREQPWPTDKGRAQSFYLEGCAFVLPAKTGQTSFRGLLNTSLDKMGSSSRPIHLRDDGLSSFQKIGVPVIMMVRHPAARLVSAYNNKFSDTGTLQEFISRACDIPDKYSDIHIQSMSFLIGEVKPDLVIHLEDYNKELREARNTLELRYGIDWLIAHMPHANATGTGHQWLELLAPDEREAVYNRYKADYLRFNYGV